VLDYSNGIGTRVERDHALRIVSIAAAHAFFQPLSWKIDTGGPQRLETRPARWCSTPCGPPGSPERKPDNSAQQYP